MAVVDVVVVFFLMNRPPPGSPPLYSSAASVVYEGQGLARARVQSAAGVCAEYGGRVCRKRRAGLPLTFIEISEPTRLRRRMYAGLCLLK